MTASSGHPQSIRSADPRLRRHAERLEALWRIFNSTSLRGEELVSAILREGSAAMRPQQRYAGTLGHVEGDEIVLDAVAGEAGPADSPARRLLYAGFRSKLSDSLIGRDLGGGRTKSWDDCLAVPDLPERTRAAGIRTQITTQFVANDTVYLLSLGSLEPQTVPFSTEDHEYIEVLASMLARQLELEAMESSLRDAEVRSRQHAQRLDALWRVVNNAGLRGQALVLALLREAAGAMRHGEDFVGVLRHVDGSAYVIDAVSGELGAPDAPAHRLLQPGLRIALGDTMPHGAGTGRTQSWQDLQAETELPPRIREVGWRSVIATNFEGAGKPYELTMGTLTKPTALPFSSEDDDYIEVLGSILGRQLDLEQMEDSLSAAEVRSRQHAERLEALWKIINSSNLRDEEMLLAMLGQAAAAIQPGQEFEALLVRVQGDETIIEAATGSDTLAGGLDQLIGKAVPLKNTAIGRVLAEGGGTRSWDDLKTSGYPSEATRLRETGALVITTFNAGPATWALAFSSARAMREPLGPHDHAYIEVLASFFANHLQQRWQFDRIQYQQSHDVLTGLLNRSAFRSQARRASQSCERYAIVIVDVDGLHEINETYGHIIGDAVLVEVGNALRQRATAGEIVGRLGGDVFGIYVPDPSSPEALFARVHDFSEAFARGFSTGDRDGKEFIARTACLGVAAAPIDGTQFESILSHADAALYTAQERGRGSIVFYVAGMEAEAQRRAALQNELREALDRGQFTLYYQPHLELKTGQVTGCEALIRWNHPARGLLLPSEFIPFSEQTGLIAQIDSWVMQHAFATASELGALRPGFRLYFNLSGRQAGDPKVVRAFIDAARGGLALENLGVEITETDAMRNVDATRRVVRALRRLNVRVAIDDFGTGYSSLSSLKRMPIDIVKIDRTFISGVLDDRHDETITETIISIAGHFGIATLAEGAERPEELDWLAQHTCRYVQGYAVCHPLPREEFLAWLLEHDAGVTPVAGSVARAPG